MKGKRIMVVAAHPDDADFYCGGTVALWARQGAEITYLICTDGALGSTDPAVGPEQIKEIRKQEQARANEAMGVKETLWLDYPDMGLKFDDELWCKVTALYRTHRPEIVLTFDPWLRCELHPDHTAAGTAGYYVEVSRTPGPGTQTVAGARVVSFQNRSAEFVDGCRGRTRNKTRGSHMPCVSVFAHSTARRGGHDRAETHVAPAS